ncbi:hypothetical protein KC19_1G205100 [Ceratodon purpureus]|uniref:Uncharacterized protein n=1 Tax=Ceratodon purpureus TaxID=3225 RepID=A0A8T0J844_CERPU|nr:hypothetical protein KC19_1G205100 [Ceratodon purpureus]
MGPVSEVFNESKLKKLPGSSAIGHVRYATAHVVLGQALGSRTCRVSMAYAGGRRRFSSYFIQFHGRLLPLSQTGATLPRLTFHHRHHIFTPSSPRLTPPPSCFQLHYSLLDLLRRNSDCCCVMLNCSLSNAEWTA